MNYLTKTYLEFIDFMNSDKKCDYCECSPDTWSYLWFLIDSIWSFIKDFFLLLIYIIVFYYFDKYNIVYDFINSF